MRRRGETTEFEWEWEKKQENRMIMKGETRNLGWEII